jgi:CheY-like chemotaxis protein
MQQGVDLMCAITNDLLDLEKLRSGKFVMRPTTVGLLEVMESVASAARPACTGNLSVEMDADVPPNLFTDGQRLRQILANGLSNACKHAANVWLIASATPPHERGGGGVSVRVLDDGPGLRGVDVSKLFEDFAAGTDAVGVRGAGVKGSGLGLPICGRFAKLMGGTLTVRDRADGVRGAEFALTLPWSVVQGVPRHGSTVSPDPERADVHVGGGDVGGGGPTERARSSDGARSVADALATGTSEASLRGATRLESPGGGRRPRIVVVDDAPLNRRIAERYVHSLGADCVCLTDGDEVAPAVAAVPCDIILMDIKMARMDGDVACRQLRARGYTGPIVAVRRCASRAALVCRRTHGFDLI